jgi:hypothetical protein
MTMTRQQADKQAADYRAAAAEYERNGEQFRADALRDLANRIDSISRAEWFR